ncbi:MAG: phospholipase D-like domain-containing protein [Candidatus Pacearchaeota archaeon]|jgi:phosphatidylserine/phosphatidylglycerophosphate/cardiolipin synthase-like enzyme
MITFSNKNHIYIGREAGKEIHEKIKTAKKSVKIVSPYLSPNYIKDLISLHKKGIKITLVTCDNIEINSYSDFKISDLVKTEKVEDNKLKKSLLKWFIWLFVGAVISVVIALVLPILIILAGILFIASIISLVSSFLILGYSFKYEPIFRIKVFDSTTGKNPRSTELIHSKIFVIDDEIAFLGSTNFTYSGFKTHYETTIKVEDKSAVQDISAEVEKLYSSTELKAKSIEEWVRGGWRGER